jgi:hypothetical protein
MEKEEGLINTVCIVYVCCSTDACTICIKKNTEIKNLVESYIEYYFLQNQLQRVQ